MRALSTRLPARPISFRHTLALTGWLAGLWCALAGQAPAQSVTPVLRVDEAPFDFYARGPYRRGVPRPAEVLRYEPGEFHTTYANFERYLRELAPETDRLRILALEETPEHRPLYLLVLSAPENLERLDAIKKDLALLADPRKCSEEEAAAIARRSPMAVWLSYSIHGDESSAFEAGVQALYELSASEEPGIVEALRQCVLLINPAQNPDGHERFTVWYNAQGIGRPEPFALEHHQPWGIYGRYNHFGFDLNRDLLAASQVESRVQMAQFLEWHPQVNADHHGETKNYFFPPPSLPVNQAVPRGQSEKWQSLLGQGNAAAFDRYHWLYYSRDVFDLFYPGYWDSWPSLHGSTGMTFESDGGGKRGFNWKRDDGTIETLRGAIAKHFTASVATLQTAAAHRQERLEDYYRFFADAVGEGNAAKDGLRQVVIPPGKDPGRAAALAGNLLAHGVEVQRVSEKFTLQRAHLYTDGSGGAESAREFPAGSYVVDLAQPQGRIARTLLAPDAPIDGEFVRQQLERQIRNLKRGRREPLENGQFYDITSWCLPLVFGVEAVYSAEPPRLSQAGQYVIGVSPSGIMLADAPATIQTPSSMRRGRKTGQPAPDGRCYFDAPAVVPNAKAPVDGGRFFSPEVPLVFQQPMSREATAFLWTPDSEAGYRLAFRLLQEGYHLAACAYPMRAGGKDYPRGTLLARAERNPANLPEHAGALARELGVEISAADSAYVDRGRVGLGSEDVVSLKVPKVAVIAGDDVSQTSYGEITYLLAADMGLEFVPLTAGKFRDARMADFNVLILPHAKSKDYADAFGKEGVEKLKRWCKDGGTLICVGGAAGFAADKKIDLTSARVVGAEMRSRQEDDDEDDASGSGGEEADDTDRGGQPEGKKAAMLDDPSEKKKAGKEADDAATSQAGKNKDTSKPKERSTGGKDGKNTPFDRRKIPLPVPGAILRGTLNLDHFLTFGYDGDELPVLVDTDQFLTLTKRGANVVTFPAAPPEGAAPAAPLRLAGFVWPDNTERLIRGTAAVIEEPLGDGHVILTSNGPSFRMLWRASTRLWLNGILYAPSFHSEDD